MYEALKARLLWLLKVPPEPLDPMGDVRTLRVFRAAPGYWRYMAVGWLLTEVAILIGILAADVPLAIFGFDVDRGRHPGGARDCRHAAAVRAAARASPTSRCG